MPPRVVNKDAVHPFDPEGKHPLNPANFEGKWATCTKCEGSGRQVANDSFGGYFENCSLCNGRGELRDLSAKAEKAAEG